MLGYLPQVGRPSPAWSLFPLSASLMSSNSGLWVALMGLAQRGSLSWSVYSPRTTHISTGGWCPAEGDMAKGRKEENRRAADSQCQWELSHDLNTPVSVPKHLREM